MKKNKILLTLLAISMNIYSCSPANILVGGGATGMVVAEGDRSFGSVVDDATIKINIAQKCIKISHLLPVVGLLIRSSSSCSSTSSIFGKAMLFGRVWKDSWPELLAK